MPKSPQSSAACPRCGYDLQGQVDTWHPGFSNNNQLVGANCPLEGTCSECGLLVEWRYVMRPQLLGPSWFVESPRQCRKRWSALNTVLKLRRPTRFWREVRIEQPVAPIRLAWYLLWIVVPIPAVALLLMRTQALLVMCIRAIAHSVKANIPLSTTIPDAWQWTYTTTLASVRLAADFDYWPSWLIGGLVASIGFAAMLVLLPQSRKISRIRIALVARAFAYSLTWIVFMWAAACVVEPIAAYYYTKPWAFEDYKVREFVAGMVPVPAFSGSWRQSHFLWFVLTLSWLFLFWWRALRTGLRMKNALVVFLCCAIPAALVATFVLALDSRNFLWSV